MKFSTRHDGEKHLGCRHGHVDNTVIAAELKVQTLGVCFLNSLLMHIRDLSRVCRVRTLQNSYSMCWGLPRGLVDCKCKYIRRLITMVRDFK